MILMMAMMIAMVIAMLVMVMRKDTQMANQLRMLMIEYMRKVLTT